MPNPHISTQDWFYHAPSRKTSTAAKPAPPASQIPGIGGLKDECANPEQDDRHFRRKWIRDTDSKYIKLAKAGGRKNLLAFRSPPTKADEPVPYPRVDWFDHDPPEDEESNEFQCTVKQEKQHKKPNPGYSILPDWYVHLNDLSSDNDRASADAYQSQPPIIGFDNLSKWQRDSEPVNFKHLMSMGYQQDWLNEHGKKAEEGKEEKKVWNGLLTGKTDMQ
ncbi:Uncharacterized protein P5673_024306 [Acropora cervicornis]|uniref:Uncharacterized protein n=1 Tax=Acropora cervicornis TaxID=6130 RepID=A0AAD9UY56_ACRCE|nr:Uncharacterized protein P5673_024306 [Acropora cervicornis]